MKEFFIKQAIVEAKKAFYKDEVPVGAIIVKDNLIIARAYNLREASNDPTAHAEILAIREAARVLKSWRLNECQLYVTLEPCAMCAGAILQARLKEVNIGTYDPSFGAAGSVINLLHNNSLNKWTKVNWLYNDECSTLITKFFSNKRGVKND